MQEPLKSSTWLKAWIADEETGLVRFMGQNKLPQHNPMKKQGGLILGIGGDNSNGGRGTFYEGAITTGYTTDIADEAVHESIVSAGYGK